MIEGRNISKKFGDHQVLKRVSCSFEKGKTNLIIGQSGSGKTVLMKCLVGLFEVDEGMVVYDDRNFTQMNFEARKKLRQEIGMLFQGGALFDSMNVEQNVMFPLNMFTSRPEDEKLDRVNFVLNRVNLENVNKLMPSELSGGMRKRVAIARAIAMNPQYLFCDEPNSGLDPQTSGVIDHLIQEITQEYNITTIVNTHDMNSVLSIGDSVVFIYQGELWWQGDKSTILHTDNQKLNDFVFGTELTSRLKK
ncbi:MAG: ATP-binding cassette domain-containing protein [Bacteroidales bacterium]|nr:ATP-binding cassette domain-containing protein [Bacteroidales bacterium]HNW72127.1 ATP-binding cassette domain-containing protein [Bacteroidales bacterium]HPS49168.1 ATP-binding cassette domain-containing protein [Bacteroidales bacterium]